MDDLIQAIFGKPHRDVTEKELLLHLAQRIHAMALDLSALTAAIAKVSVDVNSLITVDQTAINANAAGAAAQLAADQLAVNALVPTVTLISTVAEAALTPPAPAPAPAPAAPAAPAA